MECPRKVAYFTMEIGLESSISTYSGGLGILAADTVRAAADLSVPMVVVTLLHRKGYFHQWLDAVGRQTEEPVNWPPGDFLEELPTRVTITLEGRTIHLRAWQYLVKGTSGYTVPVCFLDADLPENSEEDRRLTDMLYGGDARYRICQEAILGIGGVRCLRALGHTRINRYHLNEGHAAFLALELLDERLRDSSRSDVEPEDIESVRQQCVFTTHTPVPAGHDQFPIDLVRGILGDHPAFRMSDTLCCDHTLNMTYLALAFSHYVNGVAKKHGEVSQEMFPTYTIDSITNGVHAASWATEGFAELYDRYVPGWREDSFNLRYALNLPGDDVWDAHQKAKRTLLEYANRQTNSGMDHNVFTLGFARRATPYKRAELVFTDPERLRRIAREVGGIQIVFAGKAHPRDEAGKQIIQNIYKARAALREDVPVAFLRNYDRDLGKLITAGVDAWLNTPLPPMEASGTSGMKAAVNGVPSFSTLDGWWIEGHIEGITGWAIGANGRSPHQPADGADDAASLYEKLEKVILPLYYRDREGYLNVMRHAIALNGSFFNTQRMMQQYVLRAYFL